MGSHIANVCISLLFQRKDPDQFMQLHGRKCIIHTDKSIAKAAEDNNILRKWQGDPSVMIDRFDVRSHLDFIPPVKKKSLEPDSEDEKLEMICDFERYRVLIINEFRNVSEKDYLRKIAEKEFWKIPKDDQLKSEHDKKKKSAESKASIGFTYENSVVVKKENDDTEASDDDTDIDQPEDIDVELDLRGADAESQRRVNCIGEAYGVRRGGFAGLLNADAVARAETAELRRIDREKAALAGRDSKHERLLLKKQRALIVGKGCPDEATVSLLSFVESAAAKKKAILETSSSSDSEEDARPQFITTFGNDDRGDFEEDEDKTVAVAVVGPQLPTKEYRRILHLTKRAESPEHLSVYEESTESLRDGCSRRRTRSRSRDSSVQRRSRSHDRQGRSRHSRSRSRNRSDRKRWSRSRSRERKTRGCTDRPLFRDRREDSVRGTLVHRRDSPAKSKPSDSDDEDMLEIRENRCSGIKEGQNDSDEEEKKEIARKIKLKMKKALRQTVEELKEEEEEKRKEMEKERRIRDEILYVEEMERRERERERRRERRRLEECAHEEKREKRHRRSRSRSCGKKKDDRFSRKSRDYK
ncbi:Splicing factor [Trichostrongylus colubriformis]|uniref:Splicing factor n=1 Tax=Trichostrongylus colubriformis TaxID=6319 RepID=A0AAN8G9L1_TRICO